VERHAGAPVKPVAAALSAAGERLQGEFVITAEGIEGSLIYALSAPLRQSIDQAGKATLWLDLLPGRALAATRNALQQDRRGRSWSEFLRRQLRLSDVRAGLLRELAPPSAWQDPVQLAELIHALPLPLLRPRPLDEAISCGGGVRLAELDASGMLLRRPGVWCAGEMVDWEAPTGGYLLNACLAAGLAAGRAAAAWVQRG
ncbi:MAG: NAD(P)/FAD-dependent oxidoreductase, partial [Xanthomonadales bacterium]|nr:NAD(P)/FAD-dependent oxidoreductase [Xanthomonadales bacterium]